MSEYAFPACNEANVNGTMGMTLRDWFAGQALAGYFANAHTPHQNATDCVDYMYEMANAMMEARKK